jgi:hypothetical protein
MTNHEFVGYVFRGAPERRPRLWFLDRHLEPIVMWGQQVIWPVNDTELTNRIRFGAGVDEKELRAEAAELDLNAGRWTVKVPWQLGYADLTDDPQEIIRRGMPGLHIRYEHWGVESWTAVWELTNWMIPNVHTFGRDDDIWRLGIWPD